MAGLQSRPAMSLPFSLSASFRNLSLSPAKRSFSTTLPAQKTATLPESIPPYPYGPRLHFKQADSGLYGGSTINFGNKISKGRNKGKTRRVWKPNVLKMKLHSDALEKDLSIKTSTRVYRTIKKAGGLDKYLLDDRPSRIKELGIFGWKLRWRVMQAPKIKEQFSEERKKYGLPEPRSFEQWMKEKEAEAAEEARELTNVKDSTRPSYNWKVH
ncbi:hypothetical protein PHISP_00983 [Aspergillus sp. HF37]|nr:hypothetical protein PHISP_00983 [Aspergillus sp. HF37]